MPLRVIESPSEIRSLPMKSLTRLASEIREFLIGSCALTGGHIGANLGTIELTLALHRRFDFTKDTLIFDTGHQGYTHKLLTGRRDAFKTLNQYGGMSRFLSSKESAHDAIEASHAGTSISMGTGIALAKKLRGDKSFVVVVIGDGSLAEGMALEAMNHLSELDINLLIVLNDNGYAISKGCGGVHRSLVESYHARRLFLSLGVRYRGPVSGHNMEAMRRALWSKRGGVSLLHVRTKKGHGWKPAKKHPFKAHYLFPYDPTTGVVIEKPQRSWADEMADALERRMELDSRVVAITPSTLYATGLGGVFKRFPSRCFDPGMEEQHAMTLAAGLARGGMLPVISYQSTFAQRAFDQLFHDVCGHGNSVILLLYRSGFAGYDSPSHHGIYDLAYLNAIPGLRVLHPYCTGHAVRLLTHELEEPSGPVAILMPYGPATPWKARPMRSFPEVRVLHSGPGEIPEAIAGSLRDSDSFDVTKILPLDDDIPYNGPRRIVVWEERILDGGLGSAIASRMADNGVQTPLLRIGIKSQFVPPGSPEECRRHAGIDLVGSLRKIYARWPELCP